MRRDHVLQPGEGGAEDTRAGGGLHAGAEHLDGGDDCCGGDSGDRAGEEGGVGVGDVVFYGGVRGCAEGVVAGEVNDIGRNGHYQCRGEAAPEGGETFVAGDFAEAVVCRGEVFAAGFVNGTIGGRGCGCVGEAIDGRRRGCGRCEAVLGVVVNPENFFAAGGDTKIRRQVGKGLGDVRGDGRGTSRGGIGDGGLRLKTNTNDVKGGDCYYSLLVYESA